VQRDVAAAGPAYARATGGDTISRAWQLFNGLIEAGKADAHSFEIMLKTCYSSTDQRRLIDETMPAAGVRPTEVAYRTLANMMRMEGASNDEVNRAMSLAVEKAAADGGRAGPGPKTLEALDRSSEAVARMRTARLSGWLNQAGPQDATDGLTAARRMFEGLVAVGKANEHHFGTMLAHACADSTEQAKLIRETMPAAGVAPGREAFTCLAQTLAVEGAADAAAAVLDVEMPAAGVRSDRRARAAARPRPEDLAAMRVARVERFAELGGEASAAAAWKLIDRIVEAEGGPGKPAVDVSIFRAMAGVCRASDDLRRLARETMPAAGHPEADGVVRRALVSALRNEGLNEEAEAEETAMSKSGDWASMGFQPSRSALLAKVSLRGQGATGSGASSDGASSERWVDDAVLAAMGADVDALEKQRRRHRQKYVQITGETAGARRQRHRESVRYGQPSKRLNA
jgi:hypothetical protein